MLKLSPTYRFPISLSVTLHIFLLALLIFYKPAQDRYRLHEQNGQQNVIQAVTLDQGVIDREIKNIQQVAKQKQAAEEASKERLRREMVALKKQKMTEQKQLNQLRTLRQQQEREMALRQKALLLKQQQEKEQQEKQKQLLVKQQQLQEKLLQQQLVEEKKQVKQAMAQASKQQGVINQYKAQILQAIEQQWIVPPGANKDLSCILFIRLAPGGKVVSVTVTQSSGDSVLDRSARIAVLKASPLPVPKDEASFLQFRELRLTVRPLQVNNSSL